MRTNDTQVVFDVFDGEVMAVRNDTGTYYSMQGAAGLAWQAFVAGLDVDATARLLADAFGQPEDEVREHVRAFAASVLDAQLLLEGDATAPGPAPATTATDEPYQAPVLQAFTDMQDLLLFDPIHEVEPTGWPQVSPPEPA
ncbi:hypothetical protein B7486_63500 [cyanobacterium TDX16]|nr:hypothetical protein B7486_63500 [cyanobacterium TDX16]